MTRNFLHASVAFRRFFSQKDVVFSPRRVILSYQFILRTEIYNLSNCIYVAQNNEL